MKKLILLSALLMFSLSYGQTPITDSNIAQAVEICLSTHPVTGMCSDSEYGAMPDWDVSSVTYMGALFKYRLDFNADISAWDVSNVTDMSFMFEGQFGQSGLEASFNQPIGDWDVSNVTDMDSMFEDATSFNQPLNGWDVSNVTNMLDMFGFASSFNQPLYDWDVSSVSNMHYLFKDALSFNQDISGWCVTNITSEPTQFSINSPLIESNKPSILQKTQTNSVQRKGIFYFKKLFKSRDYVEIDSGLHFMNSLNDAVLYEYFLRGNSIDASGNFMRSNFFSGTGPAQPYFDYILLSLINISRKIHVKS